jgi:hypothetical protein
MKSNLMHNPVLPLLRNASLGLLLGLCFPMSGAIADTLPTVHQIYQTAEQGNLVGARQMITQVLKADPDSAKAHFVDAELLAKQGYFQAAKQELAAAEELAPNLPFAEPAAVASLAKVLAAEQTSAGFSAATSPAGWSLALAIGILGGVLLLVWLVRWALSEFRAIRSQAQVEPGVASVPLRTVQPTYYQPAGQGGVSGSGIMSGLASGVAVGAGVVVGEELAHRFLDSTTESAPAPQATTSDMRQADAPQYDMGGTDFGVTDTTSWDSSSMDSSSAGDW